MHDPWMDYLLEYGDPTDIAQMMRVGMDPSHGGSRIPPIDHRTAAFEAGAEKLSRSVPPQWDDLASTGSGAMPKKPKFFSKDVKARALAAGGGEAAAVGGAKGLLSKVGGWGGVIGLGSMAIFGPSMLRDSLEAVDQMGGTDLMGHRKTARAYGEMLGREEERRVGSEMRDQWEQESVRNYLDAVEPRPGDDSWGMTNQVMGQVDQLKLSKAEQDMLRQIAVKEDGPSYMEMMARLGVS